MIAAVILAAGAGTRMGGPKALTPLEDRSFLEHVAAAARAGGCERLIVVTAHDEVRDLALRLGLDPVENPRPEDGMLSSVILGLRAAMCPRAVDGALCWPVDHPGVLPETVSALLLAARGGTSPPIDPDRPLVIQPRHEEKGGHPILVNRAAAMRLLAGSTTRTLRDALHGIEARRIPVPVEDQGVLRNYNTPEDLTWPTRSPGR